MPPHRPSPPLVLLALIGVLAAVAVLGVAWGQARVAPGEAVGILLNATGLARVPATWDDATATILLTFRLPRVAAAAVVGAALAAAGVLFQGLLRNPLADPYVVGTSGGAALGGVLGLLFLEKIPSLGYAVVPLLAFGGALLSVGLVVQLARVGGRLPVVTVLLAGFTVSTLMGYGMSLLLALNDRLQLQMPRIYGWLLGGISVAGWGQVGASALLVLAGLGASQGLARTLNAFSLGEEGAARLGVAVERDKRLLLGVGSLLTAAAVSISGLVGFVGLVVPHVARLLCGPDHRLLLPASALLGAAFMVASDLLARMVIAPAELPVGIVTAFLGGPFFLYLLRRSRREYQW